MEYGLLGEKLAHSHSPRIHRWLAPYDYRLFEVSPTELREILLRRDFKGLNVTIPYKIAVMPYCDRLSEEARQIGSVNTLIKARDGSITGHNTDGFGFADMVRRAKVSLTGKKVLILGSGGASKTAQAVAARQGAREVIIASRQGPVTYERLRQDHGDGQVILNTTPVGMYPHNGASPLDLAHYPACEAVLDMIYQPFETALLAQARAKGIRRANGLWMLVAQAWRAAELFTGETISGERPQQALQDLEQNLTNLVLIGMPGSGKTSLGLALAQHMGRDFVDMDAWIESQAGQSIPHIFAHQGESAFRALEAQAAQELGKRQGLIIATGGGAILRPENIQALSQNGVLIWVRRDLHRLAREGRPLSSDPQALEQMAAQREPLYQAASAAAVDNNGPLTCCVEQTKERFYEAVHYQWA